MRITRLKDAFSIHSFNTFSSITYHVPGTFLGTRIWQEIRQTRSLLSRSKHIRTAGTKRRNTNCFKYSEQRKFNTGIGYTGNGRTVKATGPASEAVQRLATARSRCYPWAGAQREMVLSELRGLGHLAGLWIGSWRGTAQASVTSDPRPPGQRGMGKYILTFFFFPLSHRLLLIF